MLPEHGLAALVAAVQDALEADGFGQVPPPASETVVWEKPGEHAPGDERDRLELWRRDGALGGRARSWMGERWQPLEAFLLRRAQGSPRSWAVTDEAELAAAVEDLAALVIGQVIGWFDEPVPLQGARGAREHGAAVDDALRDLLGQ